MDPVILIPVRGGSKGIPRKNLQTVGGISLVGRAVRAAREACRLLGGGRVIVDSEDSELLAEGRRWGAETPYVRPATLATDTASSMEVIRHALDALALAAAPGTPVVLVQATSPLVTGRHIADCIRAFDGVVPVVSVAAAEHHPAWTYALTDGVLHCFNRPPHLCAGQRWRSDGGHHGGGRFAGRPPETWQADLSVR